MQVPFIFGPDDLRLCDVDAPRPGPRDVVLKVACAGICGSDIGYVAAGSVTGVPGPPIPLGHELSGVVDEVGAEVTTVAIGDRVVLNPLINLIGNGGDEGGFAERLLIRNVVDRPQSLLRLPDELSFDAGAIVEPLSVGMHAVNQMGAKVGEQVAIFGAGPIGLASIVALHHRGVEDIVVFDLSAFRRARACRLGARVAYDPGETPAVDALVREHGSVQIFRQHLPKTSRFLEASGASVIPNIVSLARAGAVICVASVQKKPVELNFQSILAKELSIMGALGYPVEIPQTIDMMRSRAIDLDAFVSHRFSGHQFLSAFEMAKRPDQAAKVLVRYD